MMPERRSESGGIAISDLRKRFGPLEILRGVSLDIPRGSFVALLGPSGCGKTTLLRVIAGLERPDHGSVRIGERPVVDIAAGVMVPSRQRRLGMVFQHYALWPHMTVRQNICYPLRKQGFPKADWANLIAAVARTAGLADLLDRRPSQLSGGQQQRVALARALVARPSVLLLDEPLSNLDANLRDQLRRELRQVHEGQGTTTLLVTHDLEEAAMLADVIAVIERGAIVQVGSPADILDRPNSRFVARFVGYGNFLDGIVAGVESGTVRVRLAGGDTTALCASDTAPAVGAAVTLAVRGDRLTVASESTKEGGSVELRGRVRRVQNLGLWRETFIGYGDATLSVRTVSSASPAALPDQDVWIRFPATSPLLIA